MYDTTGLMIGIDEVGRGAWAGPLVVAGCYFTENPGFVHELNDSKLLSEKQRNNLERHIKSVSIYKIVVISPNEIDEYGLSSCLNKAVLIIAKSMPKDCDIQLDGSYNFLKSTRFETRSKVEPRADTKYPSVMAASILAKVERDRIMRAIDEKYPLYGFHRHVGYGTKRHHDALIEHGLSPIHRRTFKPMKGML